MDYLKEQVRAEIAAIRENTGESLREFCKRFNNHPPKSIQLSPILLSKYEKGDVSPRSEMYLKFKNLSSVIR